MVCLGFQHCIFKRCCAGLIHSREPDAEVCRGDKLDGHPGKDGAHIPQLALVPSPVEQFHGLSPYKKGRDPRSLCLQRLHAGLFIGYTPNFSSR